MLGTLDISASALSAERVHLNAIAQNLANANTTRDSLGRLNPYRRKDVIFSAEGLKPGTSGVKVLDVVDDPRPFRKEWQPSHPDADKSGYVKYPNVNVVEEMVDMIMASRTYEANVTAMEVTKKMAATTLQILA